MMQICRFVCVLGGGGGLFSSYIGSGPASTVHPKQISRISSTPKNIEIIANPKNIPFCTLALRKDLKYTEITPDHIPIFGLPKNIHKTFIIIFRKPPKILKFKILNPKNDLLIGMYENIGEPPPPPPPPPDLILYVPSLFSPINNLSVMYIM